MNAIRGLFYTLAGGSLGIVLVWLLFALTFAVVDFDIIAWCMFAGGLFGAVGGYAHFRDTNKPT